MVDYPNKRYFRTDELARETGYCTETIRRWIRDKRVIAVRFGRNSIRIPRVEYIYVLENGPRKVKK